jgi:pimeloyl-ACP methyl ester carboxylesterase
MIRAIFHAARIPGAPAPHDTLHLKIYYPAAPTGSESERMTGIIPAEKGRGPMPVVIFLNGINVGVESYAWLATGLAAAEIVTVLYTHIAETLPGVVGLTPSIDLGRVRPDTYGSGPTCPAIAPVIEALSTLNADEKSPLCGALDLDQVILGGHSAGGTVALQNGQFFENVKAVFSYAGHTMASTLLGFAPATILPVGGKPVLLMSGDRDGVIAASRSRYAADETTPDPVALTFDNGIQASGRSVEITFEGANHFSVANPLDESTGRSFLDLPETGSGIREKMLDLVVYFIQAQVVGLPGAAQTFEKALDAPGIRARRK